MIATQCTRLIKFISLCRSKTNQGGSVFFKNICQYAHTIYKVIRILCLVTQAKDGYFLSLQLKCPQLRQNDFEAYDHLIVGASTWFDGELPTYWDELIPELETLDLKGKRVALFGLGDQVNYPDNFADGLGLLGDAFEKAGASLVGFTPTKDYSFNRSKALRGNEWCGLVLDFENQSEMTDGRIKAWCNRLRAELL